MLSANKVLLSAHSIFPDISEDYDGRVLSTAKRKMFEKLYFFIDRHETNRLESEKTSFYIISEGFISQFLEYYLYRSYLENNKRKEAKIWQLSHLVIIDILVGFVASIRI